MQNKHQICHYFILKPKNYRLKALTLTDDYKKRRIYMQQYPNG
jgi:hypothetical protein